MITRYGLEEAKKRRVRILVAEDNVVNQKVALRILDKLGYRADAVADGKEALRALETIPYDLVLMDLQMPEMDGFEATGVIRDPRSRVRRHDIPVIAMTAHAMKGDRERCLEAGMDDYISKPVTALALNDILEKHLPRDTVATVTAGKSEDAPAETA
jgi:CheY-like chemotaxis protein